MRPGSVSVTDKSDKFGALTTIILAGAATALFYWVILQDLFVNTVVWRYTTGHWIEVVTVGLFFWGLLDLAGKASRHWRERASLRHDWLPPHDGPQSITSAVELFGQVSSRDDWLLRSVLGKRLARSLQWVRERRSAEGLDEQLRYLADQDADLLHARYALVRVIAWAIPIFGFLGTVIGITLAIANVTPDQLETSLSEVTAGLAVAFDTTALSLTLSLVLIFATFLIERADLAMHRRIDRYAHDVLATRFQVEDPAAEPFLRAVRNSAERVIEATQSLVQQQAAIWERSISATHDQALQRNEQLLDKLIRTLDALRTERSTVADSLDRASARIEKLQENMVRLADLLLNVVHGEQQLVETQRRLADNLQMLRQSQGFDDALHGLTAAIHLLTMRHTPHNGSKELAA